MRSAIGNKDQRAEECESYDCFFVQVPFHEILLNMYVIYDILLARS